MILSTGFIPLYLLWLWESKNNNKHLTHGRCPVNIGKMNEINEWASIQMQNTFLKFVTERF